MPRPKKDPDQRRNKHLRIPVNEGEKELIEEALGGDEFAAWAREILLKRAQKIIRDRTKAS